MKLMGQISRVSRAFLSHEVDARDPPTHGCRTKVGRREGRIRSSPSYDAFKQGADTIGQFTLHVSSTEGGLMDLPSMMGNRKQAAWGILDNPRAFLQYIR